MKNKIVIIIAFAALISVNIYGRNNDSERAPYAWPWNQGLTWHIGADAVTSYLLRGWNYGGLAIEPHASIGYAGAEISAWANLGAKDLSFLNFDPQLNITISYTIAGLSIGVTHLHYFNSKYFDFKGKTYEEYLNGTGNFNQTEVFAVYNGPEKFPIRLSWYTYVAGNDMFPDKEHPIEGQTIIDKTTGKPVIDENGDPEKVYEMKRTFSTYIELAYKVALPLGFYITPAIGVSPWKGYYTRNDTKFAVKNLELRAERPFKIFNFMECNVWGVVMLDCYKVTAQNFITTIDNTWSNQRLNFALGAGIKFY